MQSCAPLQAVHFNAATAHLHWVEAGDGPCFAQLTHCVSKVTNEETLEHGCSRTEAAVMQCMGP